MEEEKTSIHFRVSRDLEHRLRVIAALRGMDKSKLLVEIARKYVEWYEKNGNRSS